MRPLHLLLTMTLVLLYAANMVAEELPKGAFIESDLRPESILEKEDEEAPASELNDTLITTTNDPTPIPKLNKKWLLIVIVIGIAVYAVLYYLNRKEEDQGPYDQELGPLRGQEEEIAVTSPELIHTARRPRLNGESHEPECEFPMNHAASPCRTNLAQLRPPTGYVALSIR